MLLLSLNYIAHQLFVVFLFIIIVNLGFVCLILPIGIHRDVDVSRLSLRMESNKPYALEMVDARRQASVTSNANQHVKEMIASGIQKKELAQALHQLTIESSLESLHLHLQSSFHKCL